MSAYFRRWFDKESDAVVLAAEVTEQSIDSLRAITHGEIESVAQQPFRLTWGNEIVEIGDYVVSDLAGGYQAQDKEIFEAVYCTTSSNFFRVVYQIRDVSGSPV